MRRKTKKIKVGSVTIGGDSPISVQSMTTTDTKNADKTIKQIHRLKTAGCEIVRISVPDEESAQSLKTIIDKTNIPIIADIHFDYRLALKSIAAGVDGLRINPGNIGDDDRIKKIVEAAQKNGVSLRIGVNSGSLERELLRKYGDVIPEAMVESGLRHIQLIEGMGFYNMKISLKMSDVIATIEAHKLLAKEVAYPFHIGITEAGTVFSGTVKSAVGIGILLSLGIGDTIRVSLSGDPVNEVKVGFEILKALGLRKRGINLISCPTCSRQRIDVAKVATDLEKRCTHITEYLDVAVMGCEVNGPGEAKRCDLGVAGGRGHGFLFEKGKIKRKIKPDVLVKELMQEITAHLNLRGDL